MSLYSYWSNSIPIHLIHYIILLTQSRACGMDQKFINIRKAKKCKINKKCKIKTSQVNYWISKITVKTLPKYQCHNPCLCIGLHSTFPIIWIISSQSMIFHHPRPQPKFYIFLHWDHHTSLTIPFIHDQTTDQSKSLMFISSFTKHHLLLIGIKHDLLLLILVYTLYTSNKNQYQFMPLLFIIFF